MLIAAHCASTAIQLILVNVLPASQDRIAPSISMTAQLNFASIMARVWTVLMDSLASAPVDSQGCSVKRNLILASPLHAPTTALALASILTSHARVQVNSLETCVRLRWTPVHHLRVAAMGRVLV